MKKAIRDKAILAGTALVVLAALTAGTQQPATPPPGDLPSALTHTTVSHEPAPGMAAVQMHDLKQNQLTGIRERIALPGQDGLLGQFGSIPNPAGGTIPQIGRPGMLQTRQTGLERGILDGLEGETPAGTDGPSWGWLADDVGAAAPSAALAPETGGFGFTPSSGSRLYEDRDNRLGTDRGFGAGGDDAFIFQRRRDEGF